MPPTQQGLFGSLAPDPADGPTVAPCNVPPDLVELGEALPRGLFLGTSSWAFPGWRGLVYSPRAAANRLSRHGLAAYSSHPLLRAVGIDRTFYAPIDEADFAGYRAGVPSTFRFLVKAWAEITSPTMPRQNGDNPRYLDAEATIDRVIAPAVEGLDDRLGPLLFQFPPQGRATTKAPARFAARVHEFLTSLPRGLDYAVELRDAELLTPDYAAAIADASAQHCYSVHPRMPSLAEQRELVPFGGPVTVRWMLHAGFGYDEAKARYTPFDALIDPDPVTRDGIADLCAAALGQGLTATVIVNNKAEGSAPLSITELAKVIAAERRGADV